ncbi:hypothetical protein F2Q69_00039142 [Brassica cretica]|uniref:Uncharacterized protein n=1 Tax=Brassica cretica TaxID=69181 RepID=A0A8S9ST12_BRACR|nr:hypothetical protein F2Q69_00039142 [Brassica cretica]
MNSGKGSEQTWESSRNSHEFATPSNVHGLQEAEQQDLNGGGASSGLQIEKEDRCVSHIQDISFIE